MSKPFDLEAAKRGEPVERDLGHVWMPTTFVAGPDINGYYVLKSDNGMFAFVLSFKLRMSSKVVKWANVYRQGGAYTIGKYVYDSEPEAKICSDAFATVRIEFEV